jgi:hypothetical protein
MHVYEDSPYRRMPAPLTGFRWPIAYSDGAGDVYLVISLEEECALAGLAEESVVGSRRLVHGAP